MMFSCEKCFKGTGVDVTSMQEKTKNIYTFLQHLNKKEKKLYIYTRLLAEMREVQVKSTSDHVSLHFKEIFTSNGNDKTVHLCENCFLDLYGNIICLRTLQGRKHEYKKSSINNSINADLQPVNMEKLQGIMSRQYSNIYAVREVHGNDSILSEEEKHLLCVPSTTLGIEAYTWMRSMFNLHGDKAPNRDNLVELPAMYTPTGIHQMYKNEKIKLAQKTTTGIIPLTYTKSAFRKLWRCVFPNVKIAKIKAVGGKCWTCDALYQRMLMFSTTEELTELKQLVGKTADVYCCVPYCLLPLTCYIILLPNFYRLSQIVYSTQ
jgi:hypothetical protein